MAFDAAAAVAPAAAPAHTPTTDFATVIDRLVAARDAAAPQTVSITVPHAEFGRVQLRFREEQGTLSVAMASADPGFARAANQVLASSAPDPGPNPGAGQGTAGSPTPSGGERTPERQNQNTAQPRAPAANPARATPPDPGSGPPQPGIFA